MGNAPLALNRGPATPESRGPWLFSPAFDLLVGCGAWSLPLLALTFFLQRESTAAVSFSFYLLALFCNNPHYMATIYRAYHTAEDFNKYRFFTVYVTVLLGLTVVLVHLIPNLVPWVVTIYLTWSPWHYTGQNFGIAQLLVRRAGGPPDPTARGLLWTSYLAAYGVWFLTLHTAREAADPYFVSLGVPSSLATPLQLGLVLVFLGCTIAAFARLARVLPPRALLGPAILTFTQLFWFVAPSLLARFGGLELPASYFSAGALAFMHCAQYLWITTYYARKESPAFRFTPYYGALIVGGIALFVPGPWIASRVLGHDFVESFMIFMALVNLHHFILDGAIWKLRDGRIARLLLGSGARHPDPAEAALATPGFTPHAGWLLGGTTAARAVRWGLAVALLAIGILDQWQFFSTSRLATATAAARAATVNPADPRPVFRRAQELEAGGDLAGARRELERILALNPHNAPAQHQLGRLLFTLNDTAAALVLYDRMFDAYPRDASVALNRGIAAVAEQDHAKARAGFERAVRLAPENPNAHAALAGELAAAGQPDRAIAEYAVFFTLFEPGAGSQDLTGYLHHSLAQAALLTAQATRESWQKAEQRLQRAADVAATRHLFREANTALLQLAAVQEKLGQPEDAARTRSVAAQALPLIR